MIQGGNPLEIVLAFGAGMLVSFSPCVYPLLPITVGYIGASSQKDKFHSFLLSLIYVLGMAITYCILGVFASMTGKIFGQISASPVSFFIIGNICIIFGLSMLGVFELHMPNFFLNKAKNPKNKISVFFLGLTSGLIVGPCTAPVLGAILVYVATKQNLLYGIMLLFSFAYGMGSLLILAGTFSGVLVNMPKSGKWMYTVERLGGVLLILAGEYFLVKMGGALV
ncbi:MAG: sulfite exporter TauE/SafE family protein [Candidatus Omnitrophica bacterium]|nr:sulfite exporter TauE/SafE family protein [Candidatus Omnitrophota bacterium]